MHYADIESVVGTILLVQVLIAANTSKAAGRLRRLVGDTDVSLQTAHGWRQLLDRLADSPLDLLLVNRALLADSPSDVIGAVRRLPDAPDVVVVTDREDEIDRTEMLTLGCMEVLYGGLPPPLLKEALLAILDRVRQARTQNVEQVRSRTAPRLHNLVTNSPAMIAFVKVVRRVAPSHTSLLITGETGVGKEWLARAVHAEGPRRKGPFVAVNCGALPESLLESELFGHVEGAFTGASRTRRGVFETAHRGTLFLDEIAEMPTHLQVKLLQVVQSREIQRVGGEHPISVDVRIIAATNRTLETELEAGTFRQDLYYRLGVVTLTVPPLRERPEDIPALLESYLDHFRGQFPQQIERLEPAALEALIRYDWPGNVRELINVVERAMLLSEKNAISLADLPPSIAGTTTMAIPSAAPHSISGLPPDWVSLPLKELRTTVIFDLERTYLQYHLEATGGRVGETAARVGLNPRSLFQKMRQLGLKKEDFRQSLSPLEELRDSPASRSYRSRGKRE